MSRKAKIISVVDLAKRLDPYITGSIDDSKKESNEFPYNLPRKADKDLQKIQFDCENCIVDDSLVDGYPYGYKVLKNGLPVLFVNAGGDWEHPICFVLYIDHNDEIRAYIPEKGNAYNKRKKAAYGNDRHSDPTDWEEIAENEIDESAIYNDIQARIKIVP